MIPDRVTGHGILSCVSIACLGVLVLAIVWASNRGLEITDEAYYLLSAMHPDAVTLYISGQHWLSAPIWRITGSLQTFRLVGALLLLLSGCILGLGACHALSAVGDAPQRRAKPGLVAAAGGIGALLYVATIAPSPSYNLFAAAGGYSGAGIVLLAVGRSGRTALVGGLLAGAALAICFVAKPSAGITCSLVALLLGASLGRGGERWMLCLGLVVGALASIMALLALQPSEPPVLDSLGNGLALFKVVQTETVFARLIRYSVTMADAIGATLLAFWPALVLAISLRILPRLWLAGLMLAALCVTVLVGDHHLGGMFAYKRQMEAVYALIFILLILGLPLGKAALSRLALFIGLLILPFAVAVGTGNALFTQVIVSLAPWTVVAALSSYSTFATNNLVLAIARCGVAAIVMLLVTAQILTSFTREPYHLAVPLVQQDNMTAIGTLGHVKVDAATLLMLQDVAQTRQNCAISPGAIYLGLYNVPGLALLFDAVPPVSPWLNNRQQLDAITPFLPSNPAQQVVRALTTEARDEPDLTDGHRYCGTVRIAFSGEIVEIWATHPVPRDG
ncbi:hypothetical protein ABWH93_18205 [Seohaeicola saemankumensis]|uniref:hypothetical protein n=1 Tax=Seohaeicola TaxID=481178 RepID=UPI0035CFBD1F